MFVSVQHDVLTAPLMCVPMSLGHKISQLLLGMRSSNKHKIMPKWGIFNVSVLVNEHGRPLFYFKIEGDARYINSI